MTAMSRRILLVDDDADTADMLRDALRRRDFDADSVYSADDCLRQLRVGSFDVVITDIQMPVMDGIQLCEKLRDEFPEVIAIVITGVGKLDSAIAAIRAGAFDFLTKPVASDTVTFAVARALEHLALRRELRRLRKLSKASRLDQMIGESPALTATVDMIQRVSNADTTVLISGESGTGKELVARAIHNGSARRDQPFVAVNCAAIPAPLLESELFGHVKGAFTDASHARAGLFSEAKAGTVFLDEIAEMPLDMQVKLLRVLQERTLRPVGSDTEQPFEARVIAATNRDLEHEIEERRFREDLFYRINVLQIAVPPLRARNEDVLLLAQYFLERGAARSNKAVEGISSAAARLLVDYDWPGNVRELENCMERAVAMCRLSEITIDDLPQRLIASRAGLVMAPGSRQEMITLQEMERRYIRHVLKLYKGNKTHAARALGIDRRSLYRRLRERDFLENPEPVTS
jgi:two-component system response regulator HydG